ncbi:prostaglandin-endoperoxide synthase 2 [Methylocapsa palsarum]|uniref:Prostaglandin-endoperoxide synthase 2 n=2 Tax=Methylocapsa palsarum TaxID=1612308 RepID=A0A1I3YCY3_9HYPH|nr:prostaglandin-endoperoxide synthase 2 [Methylocapsa palsarum]
MLKAFVIHLAPRYPWLWRFVSGVPFLRKWANRVFIHLLTSSGPARPYAYSLWGPKRRSETDLEPYVADYVSWVGLVDRSVTGRHLSPSPAASSAEPLSLPDPDKVAALFKRRGPMIPCPRSSILFGFFAQWFTDSFLRTDPTDARKNTSNHEIDLCQIYGLSPSDASILRSHEGGKLLTESLNGQEFPPLLFEKDEAGTLGVRERFKDLSYVKDKNSFFTRFVNVSASKSPAESSGRQAATDKQRECFFASGLGNANSTLFYSAINTIFVREHNRLCDEISRRYPEWDDDRLFETARNANIALLLKVIIEDYINHLSSAHFQIFTEVGFAETQHWYRTNRITAEFDLLYRWHPFVPDSISLNGEERPIEQLLLDNGPLIALGVENVLHAAATQRAGRLTIRNTTPFLNSMADKAALAKSRAWRIRPYNEYRAHFGLRPASTFEELTGDQALAAELKAIYTDVNQVELIPGLYAEKQEERAILGSLMLFMVVVDAFSQALTNPLLSRNVYGEKSFSRVGLESIETTSSFDAIVQRNSSMKDRKATFAAALEAPGGYGPPVLGKLVDTCDFLFFSGWERFFRRRQKRYASNVFRINLFQPTIAVLDHRAIKALFASEDLVQDIPSDKYRFSLPLLSLTGGLPPGMYESGAAHDAPKSFYIRLLQRRSSSLAAQFHETIEEFSQRWLSKSQFSWSDELEDFSAVFLFRWIFGARPDPKKVRLIYKHIFGHRFVAVTRYIPWSKYAKSKALYPELLAFVKSAPLFREIVELARLEGLTDEEAVARQLMFLVGMNAFLGTQNILKSIVGELSLRPELCARLREEMADRLGPGQRTIDDLSVLRSLPLLDKTLREILRLHPPVFLIFGRATRDRTIESDSGLFAVGKGELVMGVIPFAHQDPAVFDNPKEFNPDRFDDEKASEHLIWPRGSHDASASPGNRTCPGKDLAVVITKLFCVALLTRFQWRLKDPQPRWDDFRFGAGVAAPVGALDVEWFRSERNAKPARGAVSPQARPDGQCPFKGSPVPSKSVPGKTVPGKTAAVDQYEIAQD